MEQGVKDNTRGEPMALRDEDNRPPWGAGALQAHFQRTRILPSGRTVANKMSPI